MSVRIETSDGDFIAGVTNASWTIRLFLCVLASSWRCLRIATPCVPSRQPGTEDTHADCAAWVDMTVRLT